MKCKSCNKKVTKIYAIECSYCNESYCMACRMPEVHNCTDMKKCKQVSLTNLETRLLKEKTVNPKVESI